MLLNEMFDKTLDGYQDLKDDNSVIKYKESRKTKLTLRQIRKLRKMNDVRNYEKSEHLKKIRKQYKPAQQQGGLM